MRHLNLRRKAIFRDLLRAILATDSFDWTTARDLYSMASLLSMWEQGLTR